MWQVCLLAAARPEGAPLEEHRGRREALRKQLPGAVTVLFGTEDRERDDMRGGFIQEPNFFYLTGWREPGAIVVIGPEEETLLLPKRREVRERYTGRRAAADDENIRRVTGFERVMTVDGFEAHLARLAARHGEIATLKESADKLKALLPLRERPAGRPHSASGGPAARGTGEETVTPSFPQEISDADGALIRLRRIKSAREIDLIERAVDVTIEAHRAAWRRMSPGLFEYQIAATMTHVYLERGCERAYPPIVGAGPNAVILHYARNRRVIDAGELVLMDVGAECSGYAADITRTVPANGKYTARQRELYGIVLGAQKAAIQAARPGMKLTGMDADSLTRIARDYIDAHGKDRHGKPLGQYFTHGVGHHVGLEVHDAPARDFTPLAAGMVVTIEPGLYIPEEGIGIRIEDMVLITDNGARVLSGALPREISDIEKALGKRN